MIFRRSSADLPERLDALGSAIALADGRLDGELVDQTDQVVLKARGRLRHGTTHTLVALLGATGSGKSSVANVIIGSDVATTGVRRPTTSSTLGSFWGDEDAQPLLDWLEVPNRHHVVESGGTDDLDGLVLLDVPDHDSVAVAHRLEMERIAAHADLLLWVTDAEKYADKAMHEYLRQLANHGAVTAMVLNKIDLLGDAETKACVTDLERLLAEDRLSGAPVLAVSTVTGEGVPELRRLMVDTVSAQTAMVQRLEADCRSSAVELLESLGPESGMETVPKKISGQLSSELAGASGISVVTEAVAAGHRRDASGKVGWPFTRWVRALRPHPLRKLHLGQGSAGRSSLPELSGVQLARSENAVRQALAQITADLPAPWDDVVTAAGTPNQATLNTQLDSVVSESVRSTHADRQPAWWTIANLLQLLLAAAVVAGAVWLGLLAFGAYLRLPDVPTPDYRGIPYPTGLLIGGIALGLILAMVFRRLAAIGAKRRAATVRKKAEDAVARVAEDLVISPVEAELESRNELRRLLTIAAGRPA